MAFDDVRTLPLRVPRISGEALDSWLEAVAARHEVALGDILDRCGLRYEWTSAPAPAQCERICLATGIDAAALDAMTVRCFGIFSHDEPGNSRRRRALWLRTTGSRFCSRCLADAGGRWQLAWRLNWTYLCPRHRVLLADACSRCAQPQRLSPMSRALIPRLGECTGPRLCRAQHPQLRCGTTLGIQPSVVVDAAHPFVAAQKPIQDLLSGRYADFALYEPRPPQPWEVLHDLRLLIQWLIAAASQERLLTEIPVHNTVMSDSVQSPPGYYDTVRAAADPKSQTTAAATILALSVLDKPNVGDAADRLRILMSTSLRIRLGNPVTGPLRDAATLARRTFGAQNRLRVRLARAQARVVPSPMPAAHCTAR